jgi:hypothetical protein
MNNSLKFVFVFILGLALTMTAGCATTEQVAHSGFLKNYPTFEPGPEGGADFVYIKKGADFSPYNKIMLDEVVFYLKADAEYKGVNPTEMKELSDAFHKSLIEALGNEYPLVEEAGPDVLRVRIAITDVIPTTRGINTITTIIPIGVVISAVKKGVTGAPAFVGQASVEVELLDSRTNERLAVAIDSEAGKKYKLIKGATKWGLVKDIFEFWGKRLRLFLDEAHGK